MFSEAAVGLLEPLERAKTRLIPQTLCRTLQRRTVHKLNYGLVTLGGVAFSVENLDPSVCVSEGVGVFWA